MHARLQTRWVILIVVITLAVIAITLVVIMLIASHKETYTNAWYVFCYE